MRLVAAGGLGPLRVRMLVAGVLAGGMLLSAWGAGWVPHSRLLAAGTVGCELEEPAGDIPVLAAAWWWFWASQARGPELDEAHDYLIFIDTHARTLTLYDGGEVVKEFPVAVGKPRTPTPPGEWRVVSKSMNWGGGFGTRWLGLNVPWGIYGIHGTNKPYSISHHISGGCIRMFNRDVEELFEIVPVGTPVHIGGPLPEVASRAEISGGSGKFMVVLQVRLRQAGFDPGVVDGRFGPMTEGAVREFQAFYGLPVAPEISRDLQRLIHFPE